MSSKSLILISLLLLILTIGTAAAANQTDVDDLTANDEVISVPEENENLESNEVDFEGTTFTELKANVSACSNGDVINLKNDVTQDNTSVIGIYKSITINGNGYKIDANGKSGIFSIATDVTLNNITFIGASDKAIDVSQCSVTLSNCRFINCTTDSSGAAIYVYHGNINVSCCEFINNSASNYGGAINVRTGNVLLSDCIFENNKAPSNGGVLYVQDCNVSVSNCSFSNNSGGNGGALNLQRSNVTVLNSRFIGNRANESGGALHMSIGNLSVSDCEFTDNNAVTRGGAIHMTSAVESISGCDFTNNAALFAGAIYGASNGNSSVADCQFIKNTAKKIGGAIYWSEGNLTVSDSLFMGNKANQGSDIYSSTHINEKNNTHYEAPVITAEDMTRGYNSDFDFKATLADKKGNPVSGETLTFTVNGKNYTAETDENGVAKLNAKLAVGTYKITVSGNVDLTQVTANLKIVDRLAAGNVNMYYMDGSVLTVRAYGDDGNPAGEGETVTVNLAGVTYTLKTDKNGYASLPVTANLKKNKNAVTYAATVTYKGVSLVKTVKINPILKYKTQKIKKSKKTNKIKVSLKKALKGKKIILKIKGKKITAKTNSKGVATFKIPKKVVKKLKAGKKYKMVFTYGKSKLTKKIKVKK